MDIIPDGVRFDSSGTTIKPLFVGCSRQSKGGHFVFKIGTIYYPTYPKYRQKCYQSITLRCANRRRGCKFRAALNILNITDNTLPEYYNRENFEVKPVVGIAEDHTCKNSITNYVFDNSGTNNLPLNCGWLNGIMNCHGKKHVHKIADGHYETFVRNKGKKFWSFRCRNYRTGCGFKMRMRPINWDENSPNFSARDNWVMINGYRPGHTCEPISPHELSSNQYFNLLYC